MEVYNTVTEAIEGLRAEGYDLDFNLNFDQVICSQNNECLNPNQFEIVKQFRFEGFTNPDDQDVIYVLESKDGAMKGIITSAYGVYADALSPEMLEKLRYRP